MSDKKRPAPFVRKAFFDQRELVGARWWHETMAMAEISRRQMWKNLALLGGVALAVGGGGYALYRFFERKESFIVGDAVDLQRDRGWNMGGGTVEIPSASLVDAKGGIGWAGTFDRLARELGPHGERLRPYYVPTLFQALAEPGNESLAKAMKPMTSPAMDGAEASGRALASLFEGLPLKDTAVIVDLAGPEAVAFAAGAGRTFDPVFLFDNWPHPLGVVPAHQTLAAAVYYFPVFREQSPDRAPDAPPMFVLDASRLSPYADDASHFDNRYVAKLPTAENLKALGIHHVLYVLRAGDAEQDDLNDDFVAFKAAGIDVKTVALTDFKAPDPDKPKSERYYGGTPQTHASFWHHYGWYAPPLVVPMVVPHDVSNGHTYAPARRSTMFSGAGPSKQKPGGFGRVSVSKPPEVSHPSGGYQSSTSRPTYTSGGSRPSSGGGSGGSWGRSNSGGSG